MPTRPFYTPEEQVRYRCHWNQSAFTDQKIVAMLGCVPDVDQNQPLKVLTLCRTLGTLKQTIIEDIEILRRVFGVNNLYVSPRMRQLSTLGIQLPVGAPKFKPNRLWWEVLNLGDRDKAPNRIDPAIAAGTQVFSAAYNNPGIVLMQNGQKTNPFWDAPGLRAAIDGEKPYVPCVFADGNGNNRVYVDTSPEALTRLRYSELTTASM